MSERPGPSPEEMSGKEEFNPDLQLAYRSLTRIVFAHPNTEPAYENSITNDELQRVNVGRHLKLEGLRSGDVIDINIFNERYAGVADQDAQEDYMYLADISFESREGQRDSFHIKRGEAFRWQEDMVEFPPEQYHELTERVLALETELQQRGEI